MKKAFFVLIIALSLMPISVPSAHPVRTSSASTAATAATIETTAERDQRMKWWREARFGMFIHWGLYAVPAGEYNGKRSGDCGCGNANRGRNQSGSLESFGYRKNLAIDQQRGEAFVLRLPGAQPD